MCEGKCDSGCLLPCTQLRDNDPRCDARGQAMVRVFVAGGVAGASVMLEKARRHSLIAWQRQSIFLVRALTFLRSWDQTGHKLASQALRCEATT